MEHARLAPPRRAAPEPRGRSTTRRPAALRRPPAEGVQAVLGTARATSASPTLQRKASGQAGSTPLPVGSVDDPQEHQAEAVADRVIRGDAPFTSPPQPAAAPHPARQAADAGETPSPSGTPHPGLWQRIRNLQHGGRPLPAASRRFFDGRLGHDFSAVRVHTDPAAADTARELGAHAYTWGEHLVFAPGAWQPHTRAGRHLLAHELTHVIQQGAATPHAESPSPTLRRSPERIQCSRLDAFRDRVGGAVSGIRERGGELVSGVVERGRDAAWGIVRRVAPRPLLNLIEQARDGGLFGIVRERVGRMVAPLFGGLERHAEPLARLFSDFAALVSRMSAIVVGLAQGDCQPLFAALRQLRDLAVALGRDAFEALADFFRPVGAFFGGLWERCGAPLVDWVGRVASAAWEGLQAFGRQIWDWCRPVVEPLSAVVSDAWGWLKARLGIGGDGGNSSGGLVQWIRDRAEDAWQLIRRELDPVIAPVGRLVGRIRELLPLEAIAELRERLDDWLQSAAEMADNLDPGEGGDAAEQQASLREEILPALLERIQQLRTRLLVTGQWLATRVGILVLEGQGFLAGLARQALLRPIQGVFGWLGDALDRLGDWAMDGVQRLFASLGDGLVHLSAFIRPVLDALQRLLTVVGDLLRHLPDFLLGPLWWALPGCIKESLKRFFIEQILGRIPLFRQLAEAGDIWVRVRQTALQILRQVFVDGDLGGALWRFFSAMLGLIGLPAELVTQLVANAARAFGDILRDPVGFLGNFLRSLWQGVNRFFGNIFQHLYRGVTGWLFGQLEEADITPPDLTSFRSILDFVFQLMGLTLDSLWARIGEHLGEPLTERLRAVARTASGAFEWLRLTVTEGVAGLWQALQQRLSNLWELVLGSVAEWINSAIITTASRWLLGLLDATGITPVINALIALYRAIESFVAYLADLLRMLNSVMATLGDIARGVLDTAAERLEESMASGVPVVIGFLANQFGLGRLGSRIRELVEGLRERVAAALDWLIANAVRLGRGFLDALRSGVAAVRDWWEARRTFRAADGREHSLYFRGRGGELLIASTPTPLGRFLDGLHIAEDDPQRLDKRDHLRRARERLASLASLRRDLESAPEEQRGELQQALNDTLEALAGHLTPLLAAHEGAAPGRHPSPLTLGTLAEAPVPLPRSAEEEQADLAAARQLVLLAAEQSRDTRILAESFEAIRRRFALERVAFRRRDDEVVIELRAARTQEVEVETPLSTRTPGVEMRSRVEHTEGRAGGDTVGIAMLADPLGRDHAPNGAGPRDSALSGVMDRLVTEPRQREPSKYIKGHLLNHNIGGHGGPGNLYPITAAANRAHERRVERTVKRWVLDRHLWVHYRVRVTGITEHLAQPGKHPENWINASFDCQAHVKGASGGRHEAVNEVIQSRYTPGTAEPRPARNEASLDAALRTSIDALPASHRNAAAILAMIREHNATASDPIPFGEARAAALMTAYRDGEGGGEGGGNANLTFINHRADRLKAILSAAG